MSCFLCEKDSDRVCGNCSKPICDTHAKKCTMFVLKWGQSVPEGMTVCSLCAEKHQYDFRWYVFAVLGFAIVMLYIISSRR